DALEETTRNLVLAEAKAASQPVSIIPLWEHRMVAGLHAQQNDFIPQRSSLFDLGFAEPTLIEAKSSPWTHNLPDEYQLSAGGDTLHYLQLNGRMGGTGDLRSKTVVDTNWFDLK
ncbi:MAG TPA: hypothetical protein VGD41_14490, partial [Pyrinomonadaceae bacterium]